MQDILDGVRTGRLSIAQAEKLLRAHHVQRLGTQLKLDLGRHMRTGMPEVVLAEGKAPQDTRDAALAFVRAHGRVIVSRLAPGFRWGRLSGVKVERHREARIAILRRPGAEPPVTGGRVAVVTGGASDRAVAAEVEVVARELGCSVRTERDVGVASLQRLLDALQRLEAWGPHAYVAVAGREGALAPVTAGLVGAPVIGVPVSVGYGYRGRGEAALSTMLQSCAPLATVNVDAGVVAGLLAGRIANGVAARPGRNGAKGARRRA